MPTTLRVFAYLRRYPGLAIAQFLCAILATVLVLVFPKILQYVIDDVIDGGRHELLAPLVIVALVATFFRELLDCLRIRLNNNFEQRVIYDLRSDLYEKIQRLPVRWFDRHHSGDVMTRVSGDVTATERLLIDGVEQGLVAILQILVVTFYLLVTHAGLTLYALAPLPFLFVGAYLYTRRARERNRAVRKATSALNALVVDNVAGMRQIKAYGIEEAEHGRFNAASQKLREASLHLMSMWSLYKPGMSFFSSLGRVLVIGAGGIAAIQGDITAGELVAFLFLLTFFYEPVNRLHQLNQMAQTAAAAAERVFEVIDEDDEPGIDQGALVKDVRGAICFEDVVFSYGEDEEQPTLRGVSLEAKPGESIALVGPTGAGKSTIINLLTRFYEIDSGRITLDGNSIHDLEKRSLRRAIGYVTQESFLFDGTVRENLSTARRDASDEELWEALAAANAEHFVRKLDTGLDTEVGERGVRLSVGEKQRISIARALLKDPPILLLDEATASVDTETEVLIQSALDRLMERRTSIVIAHRLSTVRRADRIYVIEDGVVSEQGCHKELIAQQGTYAMLSKYSLLSEGEN